MNPFASNRYFLAHAPARAGAARRPRFPEEAVVLADSKSVGWRPSGLGFCLAALLSVLCGCSPTKTPPSGQMPADAVAMVNGTPIFEAELRQLLARRGSGQPNPEAVAALQAAALAELVQREAVYQQACRAGFDQQPEVQQRIKRLITSDYLNEQRARLAPPQLGEAELRAYHEAHAAEFSSPERRRLALIDVKVSATAAAEEVARKRSQMEELQEAASAPTATDLTFGQLAQQHSDDQASRYRGGDIGWLQAGHAGSRWSEEMLQAAFALREPGAVSLVLQTPTGLQLLKLLEVAPARLRPFEEVRPGLEYALTRERAAQQQQALELRMLAGLKLRTNHTLLQTISPPPTRSTPPSVPGGLSQNAP